jgi:hypothetical protein
MLERLSRSVCGCRARRGRGGAGLTARRGPLKGSTARSAQGAFSSSPWPPRCGSITSVVNWRAMRPGTPGTFRDSTILTTGGGRNGCRSPSRGTAVPLRWIAQRLSTSQPRSTSSGLTNPKRRPHRAVRSFGEMVSWWIRGRAARLALRSRARLAAPVQPAGSSARGHWAVVGQCKAEHLRSQ